ncbi:MAG TPA: GAF domain-containing protein [Thermoanaerobaculia bacterium]|nr:GAF domain-containing protein [Thermoanaerobaculia bacterium]
MSETTSRDPGSRDPGLRDAGERAPSRLEGSVTGGDLVLQLRSTLDRAAELVRVLEANLAAITGAQAADQAADEAAGTVQDAASQRRVDELEGRLKSAEGDVKELASRLVESEHQAGRLMNLYVATYQLHSTLDPDEVQQTIAEIAINLLGAERFALLLRREDGSSEVALAEGVADDPLYGGGAYRGGDPTVDAVLEDGVLRMGGDGTGPVSGPGSSTGSATVLAAVPLRVQDFIVGALVVLKLFDHKPILRPEDRDLLDLLSAHAASALFAARLYATKDRKLRTLESLVRLARGE